MEKVFCESCRYCSMSDSGKHYCTNKLTNRIEILPAKTNYYSIAPERRTEYEQFCGNINMYNDCKYWEVPLPWAFSGYIETLLNKLYNKFVATLITRKSK
jgi:hypothetical protein